MPIEPSHGKTAAKMEFTGRDPRYKMDEQSILDCDYQKGRSMPYSEFIAACHSCCYPEGMTVTYKGRAYVVVYKTTGYLAPRKEI